MTDIIEKIDNLRNFLGNENKENLINYLKNIVLSTNNIDITKNVILDLSKIVNKLKINLNELSLILTILKDSNIKTLNLEQNNMFDFVKNFSSGDETFIIGEIIDILFSENLHNLSDEDIFKKVNPYIDQEYSYIKDNSLENEINFIKENYVSFMDRDNSTDEDNVSDNDSIDESYEIILEEETVNNYEATMSEEDIRQLIREIRILKSIFDNIKKSNINNLNLRLNSGMCFYSKLLGKGLKDSNVQELDLSNSGMSFESLCEFLTELSKGEKFNLKQLNFSWNDEEKLNKEQILDLASIIPEGETIEITINSHVYDIPIITNKKNNKI